MNKLEIVSELIKLSRRSDYILNSDCDSYRKYSYNADKLEYITIEYGVYVDTKGGWLKYYTKDVAKYYEMNPVEMMLIKDLFSRGALR